MNHKKSLVVVSLLLILSMLAVACSKPTPAPTPTHPAAAPTKAQQPAAKPTKAPTKPAAKEQVTLRYFMWDPAFQQTEQKMVDKFMKANPNVKVTLEAIAPKDYWPKLKAMSAAGDLPCVFSMSSGYIDQWIMDGLVMDIQKYVDRDIDKDKYFSGVWDVVRDKKTGHMHAFPYAFVETVLYYNKDAFDKAGVPYPKEGWTWDDFLKAAKKLTVDKNGDGTPDQYGFWFYGRYAHIESWVYQNNGRLLNKNKTRFQPDANAVEALKFLVSLVRDYKVAPPPKEMKGIRQQDVFPQGLAAMWVDGSWNIMNNRKVADDSFKWAIAPVPRGPKATKDTAYGWPDSLAIAATCKHPDVAWKFVKFMTGPERTIDLTYPGKIPIYKPVALSEGFLEKGKQPDNKGFLLEWAKFTGPTSFTPGWGEWRGYHDGVGLEGQINAVLNGEKDLDAALKDVTERANKVLQRYYPNP